MSAALSKSPRIAAVHDWWARESGESNGVNSSDPKIAGRLLRSLLCTGVQLPNPGGGCTSARFDVLALIGSLDLTVGRLFEAHADAQAILAELGDAEVGKLIDGADERVWAVWASEPPTARVTAAETSDGWKLTGRKAWCSGAGIATHALVTAHAPDGARLFAVALNQSGVNAVDDPWPTPALSGTDTRSVDFDAVAAAPVGQPGQYVGRPGFWHGSVGVAAVWHGGATGVAQPLLRAAQRRPADDLTLAALGAVSAHLTSSRGAIGLAAREFDDDPSDVAGRGMVIARATRAVVEAAGTAVIETVGRALGAAPLALDGDHSRRVADLQLYLRQSHGDRDLADLGRGVLDAGTLE